MTDKQIIEYKHMKCTKDDCCNYCGSVFCGYVDDIENLEKAYKAKEQECERLKKEVEFYTTPVKLGDYKPITLIMEELDQLKLDNKHLNGLLDQALKELEEHRELKDEDSLRVTQLATKCCQLEKAIEKIKEISNRIYSEVITENWQSLLAKQILQICDEVNE